MTDCNKCESHKAKANPKKGVKIPGEYGKCIREGGHCKQPGGTIVRDPANIGELLPDETDRLKELEEIIKDNFLAFYKVGCALREIADKKLYRETHDTFYEYTKELWDMSVRHAQRMIISADTVEILRPIGRVPVNEAQTRPLTKLPPEDRAKAWQTAIATAPDGKVTAKHVQAVVKDMVGEKSKRKIRETKRRVYEDEKISFEFKQAVGAFVDAIEAEKMKKWKNTSKKAALRYATSLIDLINED